MTDEKALPELGDIVGGPFTSNRVHHSWCWERPNGAGGLHYSRPEILMRCARIFGGYVVCYRLVEDSSTTIHMVYPPGLRDGGEPA